MDCNNHHEEPVCTCGANTRCPSCGQGHGQIPCACSPVVKTSPYLGVACTVGGMSVFELGKILAELTKTPYPKAIWFIDREQEYFELVACLCYGKGTYLYNTMSLHNFTSREMWAEVYQMRASGVPPTFERADEDRLFPFREPGIWVEMSDGKHRRLG